MFVEANPETLQGGLVGYDNARGARTEAKPCMCSHKFGRDHRSEDRFAVLSAIQGVGFGGKGYLSRTPPPLSPPSLFAFRPSFAQHRNRNGGNVARSKLGKVGKIVELFSGTGPVHH